jgi:hypothetical protein
MLSEALSTLIERAAIEREWLYDDPESFRGGVQEAMRALATVLRGSDEELLTAAG